MVLMVLVGSAMIVVADSADRAGMISGTGGRLVRAGQADDGARARRLATAGA